MSLEFFGNIAQTNERLDSVLFCKDSSETLRKFEKSSVTIDALTRRVNFLIKYQKTNDLQRVTNNLNLCIDKITPPINLPYHKDLYDKKLRSFKIAVLGETHNKEEDLKKNGHFISTHYEKGDLVLLEYPKDDLEIQSTALNSIKYILENVKYGPWDSREGHKKIDDHFLTILKLLRTTHAFCPDILDFDFADDIFYGKVKRVASQIPEEHRSLLVQDLLTDKIDEQIVGSHRFAISLLLVNSITSYLWDHFDYIMKTDKSRNENLKNEAKNFIRINPSRKVFVIAGQYHVECEGRKCKGRHTISSKVDHPENPALNVLIPLFERDDCLVLVPNEDTVMNEKVEENTKRKKELKITESGRTNPTVLKDKILEVLNLLSKEKMAAECEDFKRVYQLRPPEAINQCFYSNIYLEKPLN